MEYQWWSANQSLGDVIASIGHPSNCRGWLWHCHGNDVMLRSTTTKLPMESGGPDHVELPELSPAELIVSLTST